MIKITNSKQFNQFKEFKFRILDLLQILCKCAVQISSRYIPRDQISNFYILFIAMIFAFCVFGVKDAQAAKLYFDSQEPVIGTAGEFRVAVNISAEDPVNAIAAAISFSPEIAPYDVSDGSSIINFWVDKPSWDESARLLTFSGIIPGGFSGKDAPLLILKLKVAGDSKGETLLSFNQEQTKVYLHTPDGIEDALELTELKLPISRGKENIPVKFSDINPPEPFTPVIARDPSVFNNKWFLVFSTQDKASGLFGYEVAEKQGKLFENYNKLSWQAAESPFLLDDQQLKSYVYVKAIDKIGNEQIAFLLPQKPLAWHEKYLIFIVIISIIMVGIIVYVIWKKSRRKTLIRQ